MSVQYPIYNLNDSEKFEELVVAICQDILGIATKTFATGTDGGRDSSFGGKATKYPSLTAPLEGKFVIQAKFTKSPVASYSDSSFVSDFKRNELPRIKKLFESGNLDNYILFSNRKLPARQDIVLRDLIKKETGVTNSDIIGSEQINSYIIDSATLLKRFPEISRYIEPLRFYEQDIKEIINIFSNHLVEIKQKVAERQEVVISDEIYIKKEEKNLKNNMSKEYFDHLLTSSLAYFSSIDDFLQNPGNKEHLNSYLNTTTELQNLIVLRRDNFDGFQDLLQELYDYIFDSNINDLRKDRRLIYVFLHYMYYKCDIGMK